MLHNELIITGHYTTLTRNSSSSNNNLVISTQLHSVNWQHQLQHTHICMCCSVPAHCTSPTVRYVLFIFDLLKLCFSATGSLIKMTLAASCCIGSYRCVTPRCAGCGGRGGAERELKGRHICLSNQFDMRRFVCVIKRRLNWINYERLDTALYTFLPLTSTPTPLTLSCCVCVLANAFSIGC